MRPSPPILQSLRPQCLLSRLVFRRNGVIFDHCSKRYYWSVKGHSERPFVKVFSHQKVYPEFFEDSSNIPRNPTTIHYPDRTATARQMSPLSLCELPFQQSHLFLIYVVLTNNDSRIIPRKTCHIPNNCRCK